MQKRTADLLAQVGFGTVRVGGFGKVELHKILHNGVASGASHCGIGSGTTFWFFIAPWLWGQNKSFVRRRPAQRVATFQWPFWIVPQGQTILCFENVFLASGTFKALACQPYTPTQTSPQL